MHSKLRLNLEDLTVDSFGTTKPAETNGTVFGEECTCDTACTCPGCPSCDVTCPDTCALTCDDDTCAYSCDGGCATVRFTNCWKCGDV